MALIDQLRARRFEFSLSAMQIVYYTLERRVCHMLLCRSPPTLASPALLNLGCGPHFFPGWVNADDYALKRRFLERAFQPNWHLDITRPWLCADNYWDGIFTEHVIEHVTYSEVVLVMEESLRTLKSGAWIRISVLGEFPHPALAISFLTQMHLHRSAWDGDLMVKLLSQVGFADARVVAFNQGSDPRLIKDDADKAHDSLYAEARKPQ